MKNIRLLRKRMGLSQKEMANLVGVTVSAYNMYETGARTMSQDILKKLSEIHGVSTDVILDLTDISVETFGRQIVEKPVPDFEDEVYLPIVASLQCGYGMSGEAMTVIGKHAVPKSYIKKYGKEIVLIYANGMSMLPTIRPGDLLVCYPGNMWDDGLIVVINVNDSDTVKRIYHAPDGGIDLIPDNREYKMMHFSPAEIKDYRITVLAHVLTTIPPDIHPVPRRQETHGEASVGS